MIHLMVGEISSHTLSALEPLVEVLSSSHVIPSYALPSLPFCFDPFLLTRLHQLEHLTVVIIH